MSSIHETQARLKARIWQAIAQSKLDLSPLPHATTEALVNTAVEAALLELDEALTQAVAEAGDQERADAPAAPNETEKPTAHEKTAATLFDNTTDAPVAGERVLWEGRSFLSLTKHYRITTERVRFSQGLFNKEREDIELIKIQDIDQKQTFGERLINVGDIVIHSHDSSNPTLMMENVGDVQRVHEILRRAMLDARGRANFTYREEM